MGNAIAMICRKSIRTIAGAGLLCWASISHCDTVVLRDGQTLTGRITGETLDSVTIDASNGRFTFSRTQILQVTKESDTGNHRIEMERYLAQGKIDAAMMVYHNRNLHHAMTNADLAKSFVNQLQVTAAGAVATSATTTELVEKFQYESSVPAELLILLAVFNMDHNDHTAALSLLRLAEQRVTPSFNWPTDSIAALLDRIATAALRSNQGAVLAASTSLAARLPLQGTMDKHSHLASYARIEELIRNGDFLRAGASFHPDHFLHRADLFVPLAERLVTAIIAKPSANTVIPALEAAVPSILPYIDADMRQEAYKVLISQLFDVGREAEALLLADSVSTKDADTGAILQHLLEYLKRKAALPPDSPVAKYKLASWAKSMGLLDESEGLFLSLRSDPRFTETVNMQLELIDHSQATKSVRRLRALYDANSYEQLRRESASFLKSSPPEKYAQEARDLLQLVDFEKWSQLRTSHGKAEAEFQHAERLANRGEYDEALAHLNQIQMDREDSAAAKKADALRDRIMREKLKQAQSRETTPPDSTP